MTTITLFEFMNRVLTLFLFAFAASAYGEGVTLTPSAKMGSDSIGKATDKPAGAAYYLTSGEMGRAYIFDSYSFFRLGTNTNGWIFEEMALEYQPLPEDTSVDSYSFNLSGFSVTTGDAAEMDSAYFSLTLAKGRTGNAVADDNSYWGGGNNSFEELESTGFEYSMNDLLGGVTIALSQEQAFSASEYFAIIVKSSDSLKNYGSTLIFDSRDSNMANYALSINTIPEPSTCFIVTN